MLLRPNLRAIVLDPELRTRIEAPVFEALFEHIDRYLPNGDAPCISLTQCQEILAATAPRYQSTIAEACDYGERPDGAVAPSADLIQLFENGLAESVGYLRREGSVALREGVSSKDDEDNKLWRSLFQDRLRSVIEGSGFLLDRDKREICDLAVESLKLWREDVVQQLQPLSQVEWTPSQLFLDTETDLDGVIEWNGRKLHLRGRPNSLLINPAADQPEIVDYQFNQAGQIEQRIAQLLIYIRLIAAIRGPGVEAGRLQLLELAPESVVKGSQTAFPPRVEQAFEGYIGNSAAVRRIMIEATVALKSNDGRMPVNLMFCGAGGLGKTELARRVARALGDLPLIDLPADRIKKVDDLLAIVNQTLESQGLAPEEDGVDSGLPKFKYPPLVIFLDEVHLLGKKADSFLNFFEPNDKRAVGEKFVGDFSDATILAATTDRGKLPAPFLTRFRSIDLATYNAPEIASIIRPIFDSCELAPSAEFLEAMATMSRLNPRQAKEHAGEFKTHNQFDGNEYPLTLEGLARLANEAWGVDSFGLSANDRMYLQALGDGPKGFGALTTILPVGKDEVQNQIEPYLLQLGLIRQTAAGRQLTEKGRAYLLGS